MRYFAFLIVVSVLAIFCSCGAGTTFIPEPGDEVLINYKAQNYGDMEKADELLKLQTENDNSTFVTRTPDCVGVTCPPGYDCFEGECVEICGPKECPCRFDSQCPPGHICHRRYCLPM